VFYCEAAAATVNTQKTRTAPDSRIKNVSYPELRISLRAL